MTNDVYLADDIRYVDTHDVDGIEGGEVDVFYYYADGGRPVMKIYVDLMDRIWIASVDITFISAAPQLTQGIVHRHIDKGFERMGIATDLACVSSIASYVVPRAATMMARVYCPAQWDK